jgi:hypothetical protein
LKTFSKKNKEKNLEKIRQIMIEGAMQQMINESCNEDVKFNLDENKIDFFDV